MTAGEICGHVIMGEGAVWVQGDSTWACIVRFPVYEVAGFTWGGEHDLLFGLVGASSFEFVGGCRDEGGERCEGRGWE